MGIRDVKEALIGDTFYHTGKSVPPAAGFSQPTPMVNFLLMVFVFFLVNALPYLIIFVVRVLAEVESSIAINSV